MSLYSPNVILDKDICPCLDEYLDEFDTNKKNKTLLEFNLNVQIYKIINIKKLVSTDLIILNIGDFDLISFGIFIKISYYNKIFINIYKSLNINYITSYKYSINSNLKKITLGLLKSINDFSPKIKSLLSKLFSIKIICLIELNLSTNILISQKNEYIELISYLKYNSISSSNITLNEKSKNILEANKILRNGIKYLEVNFNQETISNNNTKKLNVAECFWIFKYYLTNKFNIGKNDINKICFGIFRYLKYEYNMKITHDQNIYKYFNIN